MSHASRWRWIGSVVLLSALCGGGSEAHTPRVSSSVGERAVPAAPPINAHDVTYNQTLQKSVHNAYARSESILDQLIYHRARSLELDVHVRREGVAAPTGDWFVYHEDNPLQRASSCAQLSDCLSQLATFHRAIPEHEVVTLFVDLKDGFSFGHTPSDLDREIEAALGKENIHTPRALQRRCPGSESLRAVVAGCGFPPLGELRGKFIVAVTGGNLCAPGWLSAYAGADARERLAFVAPNVDDSCSMRDYDERQPNVVILNMPLSARAHALDVRRRGLVGRIYGGLDGGIDDAEAWRAAQLSLGLHLATDRVSADFDPWSRTHLSHGFPFECERCADDLVERADVMTAQVERTDHAGDGSLLALEEDAADSTWTALISVPSSHVPSSASACLEARASAAADATAVSVCRPLDGRAPRVEVTGPNAPRRVTVASSVDGFGDEALALLKLRSRNVGTGCSIELSTSVDGESYATISTIELPSRLPLRGVRVTSGDTASPVRAMFVNLTRTIAEPLGWPEPLRATRVAVTDLRQVILGARGDLFDGVTDSRP